jgi:hypothetical protein
MWPHYFILSYDNFMITALGSCVKWPTKFYIWSLYMVQWWFFTRSLTCPGTCFIKNIKNSNGRVLRKWTSFWMCQIHFERVLKITIYLIIFSKKINGTNISFIMSYMTCEYKHNAIKPLIPNQNINLEMPAYINSSTTKFKTFLT